MKTKRIGLLTIIALLTLVSCTPTSTPIAPTEPPSTPIEPTPTSLAPMPGIPNPASQFCEEKGGRVEIRTGSDGSQTGYCIFPDGSECEEWAFFRGECAPGGTPTSAAETAASADDLVATVQANLSAGTFEGIEALPLTVPAGSRPLWVVFSYGLRNFDLDSLPSHFVAIYAHGDTGWQELARLDLDQGDPTGANLVMPDYVGQDSVTQVQVDPSRIWLEVQAGVGAHGGTYQLLSFDGTALRSEVAVSSVSPGCGRLEDLNADGAPEVVLDLSDPYVFCYACGVRKIQFQVLHWDSPNQRMLEISLQPFLMGQPQPMRDVVNPAVELAQAGLWKDALVPITQAKELVIQYPESDAWTLEWDYILIKLHADALAQAAADKDAAYPLLNNVFYGDYTAALDLMRPYNPEQLFSSQSPLVVGTVAEQSVSELASRITESATAALAVKPELAEAYFLRGWATYLSDPTSPQAQADVQRAAELAPTDSLFTQSAAYLKK